MNKVLRGDKYSNYTKLDPIDKPKYDGDIFEKVKGNKIIGKYVDKLSDVGKYHQDLYIFDTDRLDKKFDKIFSCVSMDRQMEKVNIGDIVEVEYLNYNENGNYHEFKISKVYF